MYETQNRSTLRLGDEDQFLFTELVKTREITLLYSSPTLESETQTLNWDVVCSTPEPVQEIGQTRSPRRRHFNRGLCMKPQFYSKGIYYETCVPYRMYFGCYLLPPTATTTTTFLIYTLFRRTTDCALGLPQWLWRTQMWKGTLQPRSRRSVRGNRRRSTPSGSPLDVSRVRPFYMVKEKYNF